jgi:hypothetical protein
MCGGGENGEGEFCITKDSSRSVNYELIILSKRVQ